MPVLFLLAADLPGLRAGIEVTENIGKGDEHPKGRAYMDHAQLSGNDDARDLFLSFWAD